MQGDVTSQRRWEAYDKLGTFAIYTVSIVMGIQALGLEVRSVLAIGGIGGLAIGLAGREICENILNGFLIMTTVSLDRNLVMQTCSAEQGVWPVAHLVSHRQQWTVCLTWMLDADRFWRGMWPLFRRQQLSAAHQISGVLRAESNGRLQVPFEVGDEVLFRPNSQLVEGIVMDVGWYR